MPTVRQIARRIPIRRQQQGHRQPVRRPQQRGPGIGGGAIGQRLRSGFENYVSPNIGGVQPVNVYGAGNAYNQGDTMQQIARNEWLNTLSEPDKLRAMNQMGYWTGGKPVQTPKLRVNPQTRQFLREHAANFKPGESAPITTGAGGGIDLGAAGGAYAGSFGIDPSGQFYIDPLRGANGPGGGGRPGVRPPRVGAGPGGRLGGGGGGHVGGGQGVQGAGPRPLRAGGGGRGGGGGGGGGGAGRRPGGGAGRPGGAGGGGGGAGGAVPQPQAPEQFGMPLDPAFEAQRRGIEDALASALAQYGVAEAQIQPMVDLMMARLTTDRGIAEERLNEQMIGRGIYRSPITQQEQVKLGTEYERQQQDLALQAAQQYADIAAGRSGAQLGYSQDLMEALLASASNAAANPSLRYPFAGGGYPAGGGGGGGGGGGRGGGGGGGGGRPRRFQQPRRNQRRPARRGRR